MVGPTLNALSHGPLVFEQAANGILSCRCVCFHNRSCLLISAAKIRISERKCKFICNFPSVSIFEQNSKIQLFCENQSASQRNLSNLTKSSKSIYLSDLFDLWDFCATAHSENNIRLSQYVNERLSRMQSQACLGYAEAMVFFGRSPMNAFSVSFTLSIMERPAAVPAAIYLAILVLGVEVRLEGCLLSTFRACYCSHLLVVFVFSCLKITKNQ